MPDQQQHGDVAGVHASREAVDHLAFADLRAAKKRLLAVSTFACVCSTALLAVVGPGDVVLAMLLIIVSNSFDSFGESLTAAFLPELAKKEG